MVVEFSVSSIYLGFKILAYKETLWTCLGDTTGIVKSMCRPQCNFVGPSFFLVIE